MSWSVFFNILLKQHVKKLNTYIHICKMNVNNKITAATFIITLINNNRIAIKKKIKADYKVPGYFSQLVGL